MRPSKPFVTLSLVLLGLTATACGDDDANASGDPADGDGSYEIVYISGERAAQAYIQIGCAGDEFAVDHPGVEFSTQAPDKFDAQLQIPIVNAVVADQPDAILISVSDPTALVEPLRAASEQGIAVITVGNSLDDAADFETSEIVGDNYGAGKELAEAIIDAHPDGGTIGMVGYQPGGSAITDARQAGFEDTLADHPEFDVVVEYVDTVETEAAATAAALLSANPDLIAINGTFDAAQNGVATALQEAGKEDEIMLVAYDALAQSVEQLGDGTFDLIAAESFRNQAVVAMEQALATVDGDQVEDFVEVPSVLLTPDNFDDPELQSARLSDSC